MILLMKMDIIKKESEKRKKSSSTLFPRNWRGRVQKESRAVKRRDRSTSWNSSISGLMRSCVEERGGVPGRVGYVTFTPREEEIGRGLFWVMMTYFLPLYGY